MSGAPAIAPFNLSRWFGAVALATIAVLAAAAVALLSWFMTQRMLQQEASLTQEFVTSLLEVETPLKQYIERPTSEQRAQMALSFDRLQRLPDVLRTNIYDREQRVIWSSDPSLIGRQPGANDELERALAGEVVAHRDEHDEAHQGKAEHQALPERDQMFVEIYVPVRDAAGTRVVGAIEFYKRPRALARSLAELRIAIAVTAALGAALLFAALFGLVRRADLTIRAQQRQLVDQATLAALGEMSGAVAHGLRNPLAAIRSSAELIPGAGEARASEAAQDIMAQSDRLEAWVRELLAYTQPLDESAARVELQPLVARCMDDFAREFELRHIDADTKVGADLPAVRGDAMLLGQVLRSLVANAMEALGSGAGGRITVQGERSGAPGGRASGVTLEVRDNGPGLTPQQLARVGQPFYTTKSRGLGVGLALARRVIERAGGTLEIDSAPGQGTVVRLRLAAV